MDIPAASRRRGISATRSLSRVKTRSPESGPSHTRDYAIGVVLLLVVVFLWTSSNFVTQDLYEDGYAKPFIVTYLSTSSFAFYLIPFLLRRVWSRNSWSQPKAPNNWSGVEYERLIVDDAEETDHSDEPLHTSSGRSTDVGPIPPTEDSLLPLTTRETAHLALSFCFLWFTANWSVNASLNYTSVASATILASMSGFFTLGIGRLFRVERLTLLKIGAVAVSFVGVLFVSLSDTGHTPPLEPSPLPNANQDGHRASAPLLGDLLALISALFYALYVTLLKVRIRAESRIDMQLFFGFVGLFCVLLCWPIGVILHLLGAETFELPSSNRVWMAILINMAITLSSDYLYVLAMLKTTPLLVTVGLSLTIPLAVVGDFILKRPTRFQVIVGALLVLVSFIAIGFDEAEDNLSDNVRAEGFAEEGREYSRDIRLENEVQLN